MAKVILTSDDFGMSAIYNAEIINAVQAGWLSSVSVMVNSGALNETQVAALMDLYADKMLSLGLHLVLDGPDIPGQCAAQWDCFVAITGIAPDYIDIHKDHLFKSHYDTIAVFCQEKGVHFRKYPETTVPVSGPDHTLIASYVQLNDILNYLRLVKAGGCSEIVFHIGSYDKNVPSSLNREREEDLVKLITVRREMEHRKIELINYKML
jgi:predicted glycoside hydrolase/deacetylase ChbG (UPF0249 family)